MTVRDRRPLSSNFVPQQGQISSTSTTSTRSASSGEKACRPCPSCPGLAPPRFSCRSSNELGLTGIFEEGVEEPKGPSVAFRC